MMDRKSVRKHVEFYSKNKFEKLLHLFGFIIRIYHAARSSECQIWLWDMTYQARSGMIVVIQQTKKPLTRYVWSAEDLEAL